VLGGGLVSAGAAAAASSTAEPTSQMAEAAAFPVVEATPAATPVPIMEAVPAVPVVEATPADGEPATDSTRGEGATEVKGVITDPNREPIAGVEIDVTNADAVVDSRGETIAAGEFEASALTDADGSWVVPLPGGGRYTVTIVVESLPEGIGLADPDQDTRTVNVLPEKSATALFRTSDGEGGGSGQRSTLDRAMQLTVDGLLFGLTIALAAIGLSLIFGTTGLTNFSHGELVTLGALTTYFFSSVVGLPFLLAAALAVVVCGLLGGVQDKLLWGRLRKRGTGVIAMLVVSIGFGILLRYVYLFFFGGNTRQFNAYAGQAGIQVGPVLMTPKSMVAAVVAVIFLLATAYWLLRTQSGKASRAISDNPALASASGIDVEKVINRVWVYGAGLAALAGVIYSLNNGLNWFQGFQILLLVFAGVVLGGLGTAFGAIVGSLIVGVMIQVSTLVVPPELKNVGALLILIIILLFRPQGILGRRERVG
jgi:branched-chain amino acid transport system permease protein